jgi:hypothetical protein
MGRTNGIFARDVVLLRFIERAGAFARRKLKYEEGYARELQATIKWKH